MFAIPGDTPAETIAAIIADELAIGIINDKTTAVRVIPAPGRVAGDLVAFGGLLGVAPVMRVEPVLGARLYAPRGQVTGDGDEYAELRRVLRMASTAPSAA